MAMAAFWRLAWVIAVLAVVISAAVGLRLRGAGRNTYHLSESLWHLTACHAL